MDSLCNYEGSVGAIEMNHGERVMENKLIRKHDEVAGYSEERDDCRVRTSGRGTSVLKDREQEGDL